LRNLDVILGLENRIVYDLVHVIEGECRLKQALIKDKRVENLYLLPRRPNPGQERGQPRKHA
jgi:septum site-determining protein MinD